MITETEALVLRSYNLAEADKIVVCLTRSSGLVRAVAKGSRKLKNRFGAALEPFTIVNLTYYQKENQELASLSSAEIVRSHFNLFRDSDILIGLAYLGDLVVEFSPPHQTNDNLYRMIVACLGAIAAHPQDLHLVLRYFEIWILRLEGFLPDLRRCADCGRSLTDEGSIVLSRELGLLCASCAQGMGEVLSRRAYAQLCATQVQSPQVFVQESRGLSAVVQTELAELLRRMIGRVLERQPRIQLAFNGRR